MADITALRVAQWNGQLNLTLLTKKKVMTNCQNHCTPQNRPIRPAICGSSRYKGGVSS